MKKITLLSFLSFTIALSQAQLIPQNLFQDFSEKGFIENKGQVKNANGRVNQDVKFIYNHGIFNLQLKQKGFSYELFQVLEDNSSMDEAGTQLHREDDLENQPLRIAASSRIDVTLEGANPKAVIMASDPTGAYFNFYHSPVSTNRIERVKAFNTITYQNIYPGIDLVFSAPDAEEQTPLHYDFIVHPGADPHLIRLKYHGASSMLMNADGSLLLSNAMGYVTEGKPVSFLKSNKEEVVTSYVINKNQLTYNIGSYDNNQTLVIDPTIMWGTYYGGDLVDDVSKIAIDSKKRPLVTGTTMSLSNIATSGAYQTTYGGGQSDLYVARFKNNGKLDWATYFGGNDQDLSYGITTDPSDNVTITGKSKSQGLATIGQTVKNGLGDAIIAKFSPSGTFQWSTYKGGGLDDHFRQLKSDDQGYLYLAGYAASAAYISTPGAFQPNMGGKGDCMIAKYSPAGNLVWCTYFGASEADRFHAINFSITGNLLLQGTTESTSGMTTPGVYQETFGGGVEDVLIAEFDTSGQGIWSTYYGGNYSDRGRGVETDSSGNIYICGLTDSETGIATPGAHQEHWVEGYINDSLRAEDGYLAKFTPGATELLWGTYLGDIGYDRIWGMTIDRESHFIYAGGGTQSENNIATPGAWQEEFGGGKSGDGFFLKCDYDGNIIWCSYMGTKSDDRLEDVKVDQDGFLYLGGNSGAGKMPTTPGVHQTETNGGEDEALVYKFYPGFDCYDYNEPNESFNSATQLTTWSPSLQNIYGYNASIGNATDKDWFRVKVKANAPNLMIIISDMTKNYDLKFFNAQQVLLQTSSNSGTKPDSIIYNNLSPATYYFRVTHSNTAFDSLNCYRIIIYSSSSIFEVDPGVNRFSDANAEPLELKVFPNPAADHLAFDITSSVSEQATLTIYDQAGRIVKVERIAMQQGFQTIDLPVNELPSGNYTLVINTSEKNFVANFVK